MEAILYVVKNNINPKRYFGITWGKNASIEKRYKAHCSKRGGKHLYEAMQELGIENFWIEEIKRGDLEYLRKLEIRMIRRYSHVRDNKGYNGCLSKAIVPSKEGKRRGAEKWKQRCKENPLVVSEETKKKISDTLSGVPLTEERKKNISAAMVGMTISEETKAKISEAVKGEKNGFFDKTHTPEVRQIISEKRKQYYDKKGRKQKEVKCYNKAGEKNGMFGQGDKLSGEKHPKYQLWDIDGVEMTTQEALAFLQISHYKMKKRYKSRFPNAHKYSKGE